MCPGVPVLRPEDHQRGLRSHPGQEQPPRPRTQHPLHCLKGCLGPAGKLWLQIRQFFITGNPLWIHPSFPGTLDSSQIIWPPVGSVPVFFSSGKLRQSIFPHFSPGILGFVSFFTLGFSTLLSLKSDKKSPPPPPPPERGLIFTPCSGKVGANPQAWPVRKFVKWPQFVTVK